MAISAGQEVFKSFIRTWNILFWSRMQEPLGLLEYLCHFNLLQDAYLFSQKCVNNFEIAHKVSSILVWSAVFPVGRKHWSADKDGTEIGAENIIINVTKLGSEARLDGCHVLCVLYSCRIGRTNGWQNLTHADMIDIGIPTVLKSSVVQIESKAKSLNMVSFLFHHLLDTLVFSLSLKIKAIRSKLD